MNVLEHLEPKSVFRFFEEMCAIPHGSRNTKAVSDWCADFARARGLEYHQDGDNNIIIIKEAAPGYEAAPPVILQGHLDMVCEQTADCQKDMSREGLDLAVDGDFVYAKGTTLGGDDKGAVASILEIVEDIAETNRPHKEFYIMFTVSEETSMQGTKHMDPSRLPCKNMVIADATGPAGIVAYKAPAMEAIRCTVRGRKAHAGIEPEKGINAVVAASRAISRMHIGRIDQETTSNIGRIEGGAATNIVTDEVTFTAEIRSHSMDKLKNEVAHMEECLKAACLEMGAAYEIEHELAYPSLEVSLDSDLYRMTAQAMEKEGIEPRPMVIGGGSDGNILAGYGCSSLILSVGMMDVHTVQEALDMDELWKATRVMSRMTEL